MSELDRIPPYNYCDYRCEECEHSGNCKVYQQEQEMRLMHRLKGEDPDDMKVVMEDVAASMKEAMDMLHDQAEEMGIDLDEISDEDAQMPPDPEVFPLYRRSYNFTLKAHELLTRLRGVRTASPDLKEEIGNLSWHHTIVSAKLARAFSDRWFEDELSTEDANLSAQVALRSICLCETALKALLNEVPDFLNDILELLGMTKEIREGIESEFSA